MKPLSILLMLLLSACVSASPEYTFQRGASDKIDIHALSAHEQNGQLHIQGLLFQPGTHRQYQKGRVVIRVYDVDGKHIATTTGNYHPPINPQREWQFTGVRFNGLLEQVPPRGSVINVDVDNSDMSQ